MDLLTMNRRIIVEMFLARKLYRYCTYIPYVVVIGPVQWPTVSDIC